MINNFQITQVKLLFFWNWTNKMKLYFQTDLPIIFIASLILSTPFLLSYCQQKEISMALNQLISLEIQSESIADGISNILEFITPIFLII